MKKIVSIAILALLVALISPAYGRSFFDRLKYKEATLASGTQILYNIATNKVEFMWIVPSQLGRMPQEYPDSPDIKPFWRPLSDTEVEHMTAQYRQEKGIR
jgi:hypothetical protein